MLCSQRNLGATFRAWPGILYAHWVCRPNAVFEPCRARTQNIAPLSRGVGPKKLLLLDDIFLESANDKHATDRNHCYQYSVQNFGKLNGY